jgi:hypothetical protein
MIATASPLTQTFRAPAVRATRPSHRWSSTRWLAILFALTSATFLIHGYHPLADDGGLYAAGIELKLNPALFPYYTVFVTEHLHFSLFAPTLAAFVRLTHLSLAWTLLLVDILSVFCTLLSALAVLRRIISTEFSRLAGLCLFGAFWTLPIAGTSLFLMDPFLTARSFSTPLSLLAIAFALDAWPTLSADRVRSSFRSPFACIFSLVLAALFHPLMATYAFAFVLSLRLTRLPHRLHVSALFLTAIILLAATVHAAAPPETPALILAAHSRSYWFLGQWRWFELFGLAGPLAILTLILSRSQRTSTVANLCRACLAIGGTAVLVALLFAHRDAATHLVARLQPLRSFLFVYQVMTLLLGVTMMQVILNARRRSRSAFARATLSTLPAVSLLLLAAIMFSAQRLTLAASAHLELPFTTPRNAWTQAFLWARDNTPVDAVFALDADYIDQPGEDAQTFRATARRSALPDFSKDGGEAAITPALAPLWLTGSLAQTNLSADTDALRDARLLPLHATWMILRSTAVTTHPCPYSNPIVKVCRLKP